MTISGPVAAERTAGSAWGTSYRVRFDEAGPDGALRTSGFMRFAQDLAWQHSADLGFGRDWYAERGLTWLVRAAELTILVAPPMGTTVTARTSIVGMRRVSARRRGDFHLADGTPAAWVHTDWVLIDDRGSLTRIPSIFPETFGGMGDMGAVGRVALPPTPPDAEPRRFAVRPHELDPMGHANNAVYLDWLEEAVVAVSGRGQAVNAPSTQPPTTAIPRHYRMEFAMAVGPGDELEDAAWVAAEGWTYRLIGAGDRVDRFRAVVGPGSPAGDGSGRANAGAVRGHRATETAP